VAKISLIDRLAYALDLGVGVDRTPVEPVGAGPWRPTSSPSP